ncbi:hypothetical protein, partial [Leptospira ellisii]|uniref:hypothetical protein n=1 Tax=Leptospira ellisii TaxID=2023197 RepID=UPI001A9CD6CE
VRMYTFFGEGGEQKKFENQLQIRNEMKRIRIRVGTPRQTGVFRTKKNRRDSRITLNVTKKVTKCLSKDRFKTDCDSSQNVGGKCDVE